jgi:hypothetical protein
MVSQCRHSGNVLSFVLRWVIFSAAMDVNQAAGTAHTCCLYVYIFAEYEFGAQSGTLGKHTHKPQRCSTFGLSPSFDL